MKIHNIEGCTAFSLNVDGKEVSEMTTEERLEVVDKLYEWMKRNAGKDLEFILQGVTSQCGEYNVIDDKPCESCGDIVDEYVLDLDS